MIGVQLLSLVCVALVGSIQCYSDEEVRVKYTNIFVECSAGMAISKEDIAMLEKQELPEGENVKCALACVYKKFDALNDKGMFTPAQSKNYWTELYAGAPEEKLTKLKSVSETCVKANDLPVNDAEKGCDRAGHVFKCLHAEARKVGVTMY